MENIRLTYTEFCEQVLKNSNFIYHHIKTEKNDDLFYELFALNGNSKKFICYLNYRNNSTEIDDYILNYESNANQAEESRESGTGHLIVKPRPVEARFTLNYIYFTTGVNSINSGDCPYWSIDVSTPGKTIADYSPPWGYYIDGGELHVNPSTFSHDLKADFILAPDIPQEYGGSHYFIGNKKLQNNTLPYCYSLCVTTDPAYIKYNADMPVANKLRVLIEHDTLDFAEIEIDLRLYK